MSQPPNGLGMCLYRLEPVEAGPGRSVPEPAGADHKERCTSWIKQSVDF
jgi:hypothetical protein